MSKLKNILISLMLAVLGVVAVPMVVAAHEGHEHEDTTVTTSDIPQSSGFVDDDGNPISQQQYEADRKKATQNIFQRSPIVAGALVFVVVSGVGFAAYKMTTKKKPSRPSKPAES